MSLDDPVCGSCGVRVTQDRNGRWLHVDSIPKDSEEHDVEIVLTRRDHLFGTQQKAAEARIPQEYSLEFQERQAIALESIAESLKTYLELQVERERRAGWHRLDT